MPIEKLKKQFKKYMRDQIMETESPLYYGDVMDIVDNWEPENVKNKLKATDRLNAAAPELLHRLNSLVLSIMAHPDYTGEENEEWTDLVELAKEAILKAKK